MVTVVKAMRAWLRSHCGCDFVAYRLKFPLATVGFVYLLVVVVASLIYGSGKRPLFLWLQFPALTISLFRQFFLLQSPTRGLAALVSFKSVHSL